MMQWRPHVNFLKFCKNEDMILNKGGRKEDDKEEEVNGLHNFAMVGFPLPNISQEEKKNQGCIV